MKTISCSPSDVLIKVQCVSVIAYNIAGLKPKVNVPFFMDFISRYDVFILLETFVLREEFCKLDPHFPGYVLQWIPAVRKNRLGRPSGGIVIGIKKNMNHVDFVEIMGRILVRIIVNEISAFILPCVS